MSEIGVNWIRVHSFFLFWVSFINCSFAISDNLHITQIFKINSLESKFARGVLEIRRKIGPYTFHSLIEGKKWTNLFKQFFGEIFSVIFFLKILSFFLSSQVFKRFFSKNLPSWIFFNSRKIFFVSDFLEFDPTFFSLKKFFWFFFSFSRFCLLIKSSSKDCLKMLGFLMNFSNSLCGLKKLSKENKNDRKIELWFLFISLKKSVLFSGDMMKLDLGIPWRSVTFANLPPYIKIEYEILSDDFSNLANDFQKVNKYCLKLQTNCYFNNPISSDIPGETLILFPLENNCFRNRSF